jgi:hypothetical protein
LTVSQHLLAIHGGHLELRSVPGQGTTAALVLPRAPATAPTDPTSAPTDTLRHDGPSEVLGPHSRPAPAPKSPLG